MSPGEQRNPASLFGKYLFINEREISSSVYNIFRPSVYFVFDVYSVHAIHRLCLLGKELHKAIDHCS